MVTDVKEANGERGRCENCFAFRKQNLSGPTVIGQSGPAGICVCNPPQAVAMQTSRGLAVQTMFPPVPANGFCEMFKTKVKGDSDE
jgi:hypothetical protein